MKQNKHILLLFFMVLAGLKIHAQDVPDLPPPPPELITDSTEEIVPNEEEIESVETNFYEGYNFSDEEQTNYNSKKLDPQFDKSYWDNERKDIRFDEMRDTLKPKKEKKDSAQKQEKKQSNSRGHFNFSDLKYVFIAIALILLLVLIIILVKNSSAKNHKVNSNILINFDDLDETTLRNAELLTPLNAAIRAGDYQTAYRIKYLEVLQKLIHKNLIYYKKEKTNYEYLLQLSGKNIYDSFQQLTFNFDGIWYGEMKIDQAKYESLLPYFNQFETTINQN